MSKQLYCGAILVFVSTQFFSPIAFAKTVEVNLHELVENADVVAAGVLASSAVKNRFQISDLRILKGSKQTTLILCGARNPGSPSNLEAFDIGRLTGKRVVIFARLTAGCYQAVLGQRSIVRVERGTAYTEAIEDEPLTQSVQAFFRKIKSISRKRR